MQSQTQSKSTAEPPSPPPPPPTGSTTRNQLRPVKYDYADSFACTYVVSVVAASVAELTTYPLDLTKTRLQIQGEAAASELKAGNGTKTKCIHSTPLTFVLSP
uniref:Mitochondrial uncoupling protein 4 n=1 Tax=Ceratitis capitata TaxID=7213 RepID=W8ARX6_CERCA